MIKLLLQALVAGLQAFADRTRLQRRHALYEAQANLYYLQNEITSLSSDPTYPGAQLVLKQSQAKALGDYIQFLNSQGVPSPSGNGGDNEGGTDGATAGNGGRGDRSVSSGEGGFIANSLAVASAEYRKNQFPSPAEIAETEAKLSGVVQRAPANTWVLSIRKAGEKLFGREHYSNAPAAAMQAFKVAKDRFPDAEIWLSDPGEEVPQ